MLPLFTLPLPYSSSDILLCPLALHTSIGERGSCTNCANGAHTVAVTSVPALHLSYHLHPFPSLALPFTCPTTFIPSLLLPCPSPVLPPSSLPFSCPALHLSYHLHPFPSLALLTTLPFLLSSTPLSISHTIVLIPP
jgi:hypothetical protein